MKAAAFLAMLACVACSKPVDNKKLAAIATEIKASADLDTMLCRQQYELYLVDSTREPACLTGHLDVAYRKLEDALIVDRLPKDPLTDYRVTFDATMKNIEATTGETRVGYAARQAANADKLNEAGIRLQSAMKNLRR